MNGGTLIVPDLDPIEEFRVLTNILMRSMATIAAAS